mmetsp:Transcript_1256/g.1480  ORF Transcript_1256/g.1480 Transcript_1256/m.1480 type:complete len:100 (-) Transcript_1256:291-590(-)
MAELLIATSPWGLFLVGRLFVGVHVFLRSRFVFVLKLDISLLMRKASTSNNLLGQGDGITTLLALSDKLNYVDIIRVGAALVERLVHHHPFAGLQSLRL